MLNLDTHMLLYAVTGNITKGERAILAAEQWSISAIVLWEIAKLAQLKRIQVDLDDPQVRRVLGAVHIWPITADIAKQSTLLDIRSDPADELIGATSLVHAAPLLTRDRALRRSKRIPLAVPAAR